jgi:hypothetical protein
MKVNPSPICFLRRFILAGCLIALAIPSAGQPFEPAAISFAGAGRSAVAWADYDGDHDLDVLVSGVGTNDLPLTILYRNDAGTFTDSGIPFVPVKESSATWGDCDADGDLDLLLCGNSAAGDATLLYRNDGNGFTETDPGLPAIQNGDACWVDVDRDSDLDLFLTGNWTAGIYLNENGTFVPSGQNFGYFSGSAVAFGDYDNDGDPDLLINGDSGAGAVTKIFQNNDGIFTDIQAGFTGLMSGTADWVDYDGDGDLDVAISGFNDALEAQFYIYKNEMNFFFLIYPGIEGFALGQADWGDFDHDGDPDLLLSGKATGCGAVAAGIYRNDGDGVFYKLSDEITPAMRSSMAWADFENDGDLDFILAGLNLNDVPFTKLYLNTAGDNLFSPNEPPQPPAGFDSEVNGSEVILSWTGAVDEETETAGLSYNLMVGSQPGGYDVTAPMSLYPGGARMVAATGNAGQLDHSILGNLAPGNYYWSVQSVDQAFEGSVFSPEQTFTITATGLDEGDLNAAWKVWPIPADDILNIACTDNLHIMEVSVYDLSGRKVLMGKPGSNSTGLNISELKSGTYTLSIQASDYVHNTIFIKH